MRRAWKLGCRATEGQGHFWAVVMRKRECVVPGSIEYLYISSSRQSSLRRAPSPVITRPMHEIDLNLQPATNNDPTDLSASRRLPVSGYGPRSGLVLLCSPRLSFCLFRYLLIAVIPQHQATMVLSVKCHPGMRAPVRRDSIRCQSRRSSPTTQSVASEPRSPNPGALRADQSDRHTGDDQVEAQVELVVHVTIGHQPGSVDQADGCVWWQSSREPHDLLKSSASLP